MSRIDVLAADYFTAATDKGVILRLFVKVGDRIARDAPMAELETDKATIEVAAPAAGIVEELMANVGDVVDAKTVLARIVTSGEAIGVPPKPSPVVAKRSGANEPRCAFCRTLRVSGRIDCVKCGAPY